MQSLSLYCRAAVRTRLVTDSYLASTLALHPQTVASIAVLHGSMSDNTPVFPSITFRVKYERPDQRFAPTDAEGGGQSTEGSIDIEIECWDNRQTESKYVAMIGDQVCKLLSTKLSLPENQGQIFRLLRTMRTEPIWDDKLKAWVVALSFRGRYHFNYDYS